MRRRGARVRCDADAFGRTISRKGAKNAKARRGFISCRDAEDRGSAELHGKEVATCRSLKKLEITHPLPLPSREGRN